MGMGMDPSSSLAKGMALRGSYFDATPDLDSSESSPDSMNGLLRLGSLGPCELDPTSQMWESSDYGIFDTFDTFGPPSTASQDTVKPSDGGSQNTAVSGSKVRRRAQNRASQRAFRERKDRHVKGLECQLENLNEKHQDLLASYSKQAVSVQRLYQQIADLQTQIRTIKSRSEHDLHANHNNNGHLPLPDTFDAFSFPMDLNLDPMLYDGNELGLDQNDLGAVNPKPNSGNDPPMFEDLLAIT